MQAFFSGIKLFFFGIWSFISIMLGGLAYLVRIKNGMPWIAKHFWTPMVLFFLQVRLEVEGIENVDKKENYLIMGNHNSFVDIPVLFKTLPFYTYFIAKKELKKIPLLGWYIGAYGMIYIDRSDRNKSRESIAKASQLISNGKRIIIFPEGTKSKDGTIGPFKKGGFHLASQAKVSILPVKINGANKVWPNRKSFQLKRGTIKVTIGKPILHSSLSNYSLDEQVNFVHEYINKL